MKILCEMGHSGQASIIRGWERVSRAGGHSFTLWDPTTKPTYDAFDETDPDLFIVMRPPLRAVTKCIEERKGMVVTDQSAAQPAADTFLYDGAEFSQSLACDFCYVGNYRDEKRRMLDSYVAALSQRGSLKIFGGGDWPFHQHLGQISDRTAADLYASAKVSINVSHSGRTNQRVYQILMAGGICVSNTLKDNVFDHHLVAQGDNPITCRDNAAMLASKKLDGVREKMRIKGRNAVLSGHTYWHRCKDMLETAGFAREATRLMEIHRALIAV